MSQQVKSETIDLEYPVSVHGEEIKSITLRRPKVKDLVASQHSGKTEAESEVNLVAVLSGVNPEDVMEIDGKDYGKIQSKLKDFLS